MAKLLVFVVALATLAVLAKYALDRTASSAEGQSAPARQLDNVRGAADRATIQTEQRIGDIEQKTR